MTETAAFYGKWGQFLPDQIDGLFVSLQLTAAILALGLPLGVILAFLVTAQSRTVRWIGLVLVEVGRGIPAFVLLLLIYYGLPQVEILLAAFPSGVIAFGIAMGAYTSEVFRGAFAAVNPGQKEAASAVGFSNWDVFRYVTFPQALRIATPALLGWAILFFQATSLTFMIAVPELMSVANTQGSVTLDYMSAFTLAGVLYAVISIPGSLLVSVLERHLEGSLPPPRVRFGMLLGWLRPRSPASPHKDVGR